MGCAAGGDVTGIGFAAGPAAQGCADSADRVGGVRHFGMGGKMVSGGTGALVKCCTGRPAHFRKGV